MLIGLLYKENSMIVGIHVTPAKTKAPPREGATIPAPGSHKFA